jgi:hypothetical protein
VGKGKLILSSKTSEQLKKLKKIKKNFIFEQKSQYYLPHLPTSTKIITKINKLEGEYI